MQQAVWALAMAVLLAAVGCDKVDGASGSFDRPESLCVATATQATLKGILFDEARKASGDEPLRLNDLERQSSLAVSQAVLDGNDSAIRKVTCKGRLTLELPVGVAQAFAGERALQADIVYTVQPTAHDIGNLVAIEGANGTIARLAAADLTTWIVSRPRGATQALPATAVDGLVEPEDFVAEAIVDAPREPATTASFDCATASTRAETIVCSNEILRRKDRQLARNYADYVATLSEYGARAVQIDQRDWLARRDACDNAACVADQYAERMTAIANSN